MKILLEKDIGSYTFNATGQTITFAGITVSPMDIFLITNTSGNTIIYNFAKSGMGGTISGSTLTLEYNTTAMHDTDELQILIEIGEPHIDFDIGVMKTMELSPLYNRYTDYETLVSAQNLTGAYADYGAEIDMRAYTHLGTYIVADVNDSTEVYMKLLGKHTPAGTEEFIINDITDTMLWSGTTADFNKYLCYDCRTLPYIQLQAYAISSGATVGDLTIYINKFYRGGIS